MNCRICGKEIGTEEEICNSCSDEIEKLGKEFKKVKKQRIIIRVMIMLPIIFTCIVVIISLSRRPCNTMTLLPSSQMSSQEIDAANAQWIGHEGKQTGRQVSALITKLIANAESFQDEQHLVVGLEIQANQFSEKISIIYDGTNVDKFINQLEEQQKKVIIKHDYNITLDYEGTALIKKMIVNY